MKKIGTFFVIFAASTLGVLVALQIDRSGHRAVEATGPYGTDKDFPYSTPVSFSQLPGGPPDFVAAAKKITPSVVSVDQRVATRDMFSDRVQVETAGTGSGVIISQSGLILTNNHVISGADFVIVRSEEGKTYSAKVVGADPRSDLAVLKISATNLTPADLGDSSKMEVGQWVLAVGNPLGYANTVSAGVVSSLKRTLPETEGGVGLLIDAIQTDAAINPGNSGGALTNAQGQVIGINSVIASTNGGSVGLGFAIPINAAKKVVHDIIQYGHVRYGEPGFAVYPRLLQDPDIQAQLRDQVGAEPPKTGLIIVNVNPNGPAAHAGIKPLDVVETINGVSMDTPITFSKLFADRKPGETVHMKVWQAGNVKTIDLQLADITTF